MFIQLHCSFVDNELLCHSWTWKGKASVFCFSWRKRWPLPVQSKGESDCFRSKLCINWIFFGDALAMHKLVRKIYCNRIGHYLKKINHGWTLIYVFLLLLGIGGFSLGAHAFWMVGATNSSIKETSMEIEKMALKSNWDKDLGDGYKIFETLAPD